MLRTAGIEVAEGVRTEAATALPAGVTVAVTQLRSDVADRQVEVQVHNGSDEAIEIGAVSLDDPWFAAPATRVVDRTSTLAPGRTVNVRVQLADVVCDGTATPGATVTFAYTQGDRAGTASAAAGEVFPFLDALHRRECVAARTAAAADVTWSAFTPSEAGAPASLELSIVPRSGAAAAVVLADVPPCKTVAGVPARIVGDAGCSAPSDMMNQILGLEGIV